MKGTRPKNDDLRAWLQSRFDEIDGRISSLEVMLGENGRSLQVYLPPRVGKLRPALLKTVKQLSIRFDGLATAEQLSKGTMSYPKPVQ